MNVTARPRYRVSVALEEPFVMYNSSGDSMYGYCIDFLDAMANVLDCDYDVKESSDKQFGHTDRSGEWNGIIKELMMNKADIGAGALWITHQRRQVCCYPCRAPLERMRFRFLFTFMRMLGMLRFDCEQMTPFPLLATGSGLHHTVLQG